MNVLPKLYASRFKGVPYFLALYGAISMATRTLLLVLSWQEAGAAPLALLEVYAMGLGFDLLSAGYLLIPFVLYLLLTPDKWFNHHLHRLFALGMYFVLTASLLFGAFSEVAFWDEFGARFNFIAVDYLVYTWEVTNNIWESYNIPLLVALLLLGTVAIFWLTLRKQWLEPSFAATTRFGQRFMAALPLLLLPPVAYVSVGQEVEGYYGNRYHAELAKNGLYSLFSAYINNSLDYPQFYAVLQDQQVWQQARKLLAAPHARFVSHAPEDLTREMMPQGPEHRYNVIMVCVESLSAEYMERFGNQEHITPFLDSLSGRSLFFSNLYATGTRTVRGMEALSLSVPPTPGSSIVRRPNNEELHSIGQVFRQRGYDNKFLYGGYGYFDNMNHFWGNNGFQVIDRDKFSKEEVQFANVWGICDEDVFTRAIKEADASHAQGKPFFHYVMTTSNHRPYTYPEGRIDIPSHTGRTGGVKYTDHALRQLIAQAEQKPWFKNTLIVIVADHCGSSAGRSSVNVDKYHIPLFVYNPGLVPTQQVDKLCSQIDVAPTLFSLLNWRYKTKSYGQDILRMRPEEERAFVSTYQKLGYLKGGKLLLLDVQQRADCYQVAPGQELKPLPMDEQMRQEAIGYYQSAYEQFKRGLLKASI